MSVKQASITKWTAQSAAYLSDMSQSPCCGEPSWPLLAHHVRLGFVLQPSSCYPLEPVAFARVHLKKVSCPGDCLGRRCVCVCVWMRRCWGCAWRRLTAKLLVARQLSSETLLRGHCCTSRSQNSFSAFKRTLTVWLLLHKEGLSKAASTKTAPGSSGRAWHWTGHSGLAQKWKHSFFYMAFCSGSIRVSWWFSHLLTQVVTSTYLSIEYLMKCKNFACKTVIRVAAGVAKDFSMVALVGHLLALPLPGRKGPISQHESSHNTLYYSLIQNAPLWVTVADLRFTSFSTSFLFM